MHAIGSDYCIGLDTWSVGECEPYLPCELVESDQLLVDMDDVLREHGEQRLMQIRAMHTQVRCAEETLRHGELAHDPARVPFSVEMRVRLEGDPAQSFLDPDPAEDLHRIRHHLD